MKIKKKIGGCRVGGVGGGGQSRCERRNEVFVKIQKNGESGRGIWLGGPVGGGWSGWGGGGGGGGQGGCERRIEVL